MRSYPRRKQRKTNETDHKPFDSDGELKETDSLSNIPWCGKITMLWVNNLNRWREEHGSEENYPCEGS